MNIRAGSTVYVTIPVAGSIARRAIILITGEVALMKEAKHLCESCAAAHRVTPATHEQKWDLGS